MPPKRPRRIRPPRNTAPLWKKLTIVMTTVIVLIVVVSALQASKWGFLPFIGLVVVVVAGMLWLMSRLLGIHLSLRSWD